MKCHWTTLEDGTRFFMSYCYGSMHDEDGRNCYCYDVQEPRMTSAEARREINQLTAENARLNRIIRNLLKRRK